MTMLPVDWGNITQQAKNRDAIADFLSIRKLFKERRKEIGQQIRDERKRRGWFGKDLAIKLNISKNLVSLIELGKTTISISVLEGLHELGFKVYLDKPEGQK